MNKILISACLLDEPVRYDGKSLTSEHPAIKQWQNAHKEIQKTDFLSARLLNGVEPWDIRFLTARIRGFL